MKNLLIGLVVLVAGACGGDAADGSYHHGGRTDARPWTGGADAGVPSPDGGGSFGNVGVGGGQDFGAFRRALDQGLIPSPDSIEATGFFAEHYTSLPAPTCGERFCLHGMLSVTPDPARGGTMTLLQMAMNSPIDPATVPKPPLDLVLVIDHSGSMGYDDKLVYVKEGVKLLVDQLGPADTLTLIAFDDRVKVLYGPAAVVDRERIKAIVDQLRPEGATNIHDALERGYQEALRGLDDHQRRVIFLTDGLPTAGNTSPEAIRQMSAGYNERYVQLTTVAVGLDAGLTLLRGLAEQGGGNFYFLEDPEAAREVFVEELRFFVAPIAYDVSLSFDSGRAYGVKALHGTALWQRTLTGGRVFVPSVYLVSRTSTDPGDPGTGGGRRGGGSAIIAELTPDPALDGPGHRVATARLRYRLPGTTVFEEQAIDVTYGDVPGVCGEAGFASHPEMDKNSLVMAFFVAFREATVLAQRDRAAAAALLERFQERIEHRIVDRDDEDLLDDLEILARFIQVLRS
jgi:Ca-activated chloride channel family protein